MKRALVAFAALSAACNAGPRGQANQSIPSDSTEFYRSRVDQLALVSSTKDSLFHDLTETTKLLADINAEITKVTPKRKKAVDVAVATESSNDRALVLKKVKDLADRIRSSESRLAASQKRLQTLTGESDSLKASLVDFQHIIDGLKTMVDDQKSTIANLESELNATKAQVTQLSQDKQMLQDTVSAMTTRENTVYYVAGTKKELMKKGLVREVGGTRFLLVTRTGETLKPAEKLDPSAFTAIDRRQALEIKLPKADKKYKVVTSQNLQYSNLPANAKGKIQGSLQITSPDNFWTNSRFLILVEN